MAKRKTPSKRAVNAIEKLFRKPFNRARNTIQVFDRGAGYGWGVRIVEDKTHEYSANIYEEKEARKFAALVKDFLNAGLSRSEAWSSAWKIAVKW